MTETTCASCGAKLTVDEENRVHVTAEARAAKLEAALRMMVAWDDAVRAAEAAGAGDEEEGDLAAELKRNIIDIRAALADVADVALEAVAEDREACALECDGEHPETSPNALAAKIRARGA